MEKENKDLRQENNSLRNIIKYLFNRLKEFLREVLKCGNDYSRDLASDEVKFNYNIDNFNQNDVYQISRGTSQEDELFNYADIPNHYKEYNNNYQIDDNKYNMMIIISKQIYENKDNKKEYKKMLANLKKKKIFTKHDKVLCLKPIFTYSKSEVESALKKLNRQAEKEVEKFYNMDKIHDDCGMSL